MPSLGVRVRGDLYPSAPRGVSLFRNSNRSIIHCREGPRRRSSSSNSLPRRMWSCHHPSGNVDPSSLRCVVARVCVFCRTHGFTIMICLLTNLLTYIHTCAYFYLFLAHNKMYRTNPANLWFLRVHRPRRSHRRQQPPPPRQPPRTLPTSQNPPSMPVPR